MLTRAANPFQNGTERQDDTPGNRLAAGIKHSPDDVQLIGESLDQNKGLKEGTVLDQPRNKSKRKRKAANRPDSSSKKVKHKHGRLKLLNRFSNISKSTR